METDAAAADLALVEEMLKHLSLVAGDNVLDQFMSLLLAEVLQTIVNLAISCYDCDSTVIILIDNIVPHRVRNKLF